MYAAPEVFGGAHHYNTAADVFSFAIMLLEMLFANSRAVISQYRELADSIAIVKGWRPTISGKLRADYPRVCALIERCWVHEFNERPTFLEIFARLHTETRPPEYRPGNEGFDKNNTGGRGSIVSSYGDEQAHRTHR